MSSKRVVVAAAQLDRHLARDRKPDPALQALAQHQRLRIEPAALVEQPPEPAAHRAVVVDRRLVVDRVDEPLVGDEEQREPRRLVDAPRLRLDDAVLDLIRHSEPVPSADLVRGDHELDPIAELRAVQRDRPALVEAHRHGLGLDRDGLIPVGDAHDRLDERHRAIEQLELLRLVRRAPDVRVGGVRLLDRRAVREVALEQPLAHLLATAELLDELRVEPRLVDPERRVREQAVAEEALDVVALVGRPVAPDVDAVLAHRVHEHRPRDGAAERRRVEVRLAAARDVEGAALQRHEPLVDELLAAVDELGRLGAVVERALADARDVRLVVLTEVGGEGVGDPALLTDPGDRDGRVETAGEGDADPFADGERLQDAAHSGSLATA